MKKMLAALLTLVLLLGSGAFASQLPQGEEAPFLFRNGVRFGMSVQEVLTCEAQKRYELDTEETRGPVRFTELEYEDVEENGALCELKYLFVQDALAAIRVSYEGNKAPYAKLFEQLSALYGQAAAPELTLLGNGVYALDDEGRPEGLTDAWLSGDVLIVTQLDEDDIEISYIDLAAEYIAREQAK